MEGEEQNEQNKKEIAGAADRAGHGSAVDARSGGGRTDCGRRWLKRHRDGGGRDKYGLRN